MPLVLFLTFSLTLAFFYSNPLPPTSTHSCVHYSCEAIDCQEPLIRNAELKCSNPGQHFYNGDRCIISCNSGYVLQVHQEDDIIKTQISIVIGEAVRRSPAVWTGNAPKFA
ncbi:hypothetical protein ATANTOWER_004988 [Ataeniobius toweri]|uniref:Uncharacterized protein n=1 Tax=Ataeniobius toweri TaxID=208326 RepID=A0ABU7B4U5_9TELE|nr:hypothetical protein [Ataeniobius toweri]